MEIKDKRIDEGKAFDWGKTSKKYDLMVPFTKESWHSRIRASRGIGASLNPQELAKWDAEHRAMLEEIAPEKFEILHYGAITVLQKK